MDKLNFLATREKALSFGFTFGLWLLIIGFFSVGGGEGPNLLWKISSSPVFLPEDILLTMKMKIDNTKSLPLGCLFGGVITFAPPIIWTAICWIFFSNFFSGKWKIFGIAFISSHYVGVLFSFLSQDQMGWERLKETQKDIPLVIPTFFCSYLFGNLLLWRLFWKKKNQRV